MRCNIVARSSNVLVLSWEILVLSWEVLVLSWEILVLSWEILVLSWEILVLSWEILVLIWEVLVLIWEVLVLSLCAREYLRSHCNSPFSKRHQKPTRNPVFSKNRVSGQIYAIARGIDRDFTTHSHQPADTLLRSLLAPIS
ncbi:hypothetical protein [Microseira wollei]|uniref:Transposase n=1 Tax=Microseira wollei NIES-4236 TaxID=2530354 RepID=A0AAV3XQZ7_9CYAN|nr:hypothetical protein [Microseira wollei]GET43259.1 hypothetical protein MiSe_80810 [Microseira wollei NIES-4236]